MGAERLTSDSEMRENVIEVTEQRLVDAITVDQERKMIEEELKGSDPIKILELRRLAIRYKHQNVSETRQYGMGMEKVLRELGLWDVKEMRREDVYARNH